MRWVAIVSWLCCDLFFLAHFTNGGTTSYSTRTPVYFANIPMFRLCFTQRFFRYKTIQWWNALPSSVTDCINSPFYEYVGVL